MLKFFSLLKNVEERFNCSQLLEELFIVKYFNNPMDLSFLKNIINQIEKK